MEHGTETAYRAACRCDLCRAANARGQQQRRATRRARLKSKKFRADVEHGLASTYGNWGCRCRPCTDAWAADAKDRKARV